LDRHAAIIAAGKLPMGRPPVTMEQSSRVAPAQRAVQAEHRTDAADVRRGILQTSQAETPAEDRGEHDRSPIADHAYAQGIRAGIQRTGRRQRSDQVILAVTLGQSTNDQGCFLPMMHAATRAAAGLHGFTGNDQHLVGTVLADAGYAAEANLAAPGPDRLIALGKGRDHAKTATREPTHGPPSPDATAREAMDHRLRTEQGRALYKRRGATVEPAIGNLKKILDRFSCRGLDAALGELQLAASAFNLMKIYRAANT
jgi:hypothetical protein